MLLDDVSPPLCPPAHPLTGFSPSHTDKTMPRKPATVNPEAISALVQAPLDAPDILIVDVDERGPRPSLKELVAGEDGSTRRAVTWWAAGMVVATAVRDRKSVV